MATRLACLILSVSRQPASVQAYADVSIRCASPLTTATPARAKAVARTRYRCSDGFNSAKQRLFCGSLLLCVAGVPNSPALHSVLTIHAVGYGHRHDLGSFQAIQTAPGFKRPYKRVENADGFQKLDTVEIVLPTVFWATP